MVVDALAYHPAVAHYVRFIATTVGRDKLLRTLQYFARFYGWYLFRTNKSHAAIAPWTAIKTQFAMTRKLMRVGKNIEHFKAAAVVAAASSRAAAAGETGRDDTVMKYLTIGRQLGYGTYLSLDILTYLHGAGIRHFASNAKIARNAAKAWLFGLLCSVVAGVYSLKQLKAREKGVDKKDGESVVVGKMIERERATVMTQLVSDVCDLTIPSTTLGYTTFDDGIVGIAGVISSLIGVRAAWGKTA